MHMYCMLCTAGRTGRAGASGTAHTFFTPADAKHARELIKVRKGSKVDE